VISEYCDIGDDEDCDFDSDDEVIDNNGNDEVMQIKLATRVMIEDCDFDSDDGVDQDHGENGENEHVDIFVMGKITKFV